jgi:hypothetical protein
MCASDAVLWEVARKRPGTGRFRDGRLLAVFTTVIGKRSKGPWIRDIHPRTTNGAIDPTRMFHNGRDGPELTQTLGALDINDMNQMKTLIRGFTIA